MTNSEQACNEIVTVLQRHIGAITVFLVNADSGDIQAACLDNPASDAVVQSYEIVPGAAIVIQFGTISVPWPRGLTIVE